MKILKKIWKMCGEEKGSMQIICLLCTVLCLYTVVFHVRTPELNAMMIGLMLMMWLLAWAED